MSNGRTHVVPARRHRGARLLGVPQVAFGAGDQRVAFCELMMNRAR
jgi:hypothetical protein